MNPHLVRASMLLGQERHEQAIVEVRLALAEAPDDCQAHAMLALCLLPGSQYDEATEHAERAIHLAPDWPHAHYVRSAVLFERRDFAAAEQGIREAIRLDPHDPSYFGFLAQTLYVQKRWEECQHAAQEGLKLDPESVDCTNFLAMALTKLGRAKLAGDVIQRTLERDPEDAASHANLGWVYLDQGNYAKAQEHFRESLRLAPESEWARAGMLETLKAGNPVYRLALRYFLWMAKLSGNVQFVILLGGYMGQRFLNTLAADHPALRPLVVPLIVAYVAFAVMTWVAQPLSDLTLRLHPFGKLVLSRQEIVRANWVGAWVFLALFFLAAAFLTPLPGLFYTAATFGFTLPGVVGVFACEPGWPRKTMLALTIGLFACGVVQALPYYVSWFEQVNRDDAVARWGESARSLFVPCAIGLQFAVGGLASVRVKK